MKPREELAPDEIALSSPEFWRLPEEVVEGAFVTLRREAPVTFHEEVAHPPLVQKGPGYWAVTRYADIDAVSRDPGTFCSGKGIAIWDWPADMAAMFSHMASEDEPRHTRLRRIVSRAFTPKVLKALRPMIEEEARIAVDEIIHKGRCEFVSEVAGRLPVRLICELLGIPAQYHAQVYDQATTAIKIADPALMMGSGNVEEALGKIISAGLSLSALMVELGGERRRKPGDDVLSMLVNADVDGEALDDVDLTKFFILLTAAGIETTRNALAYGMHALSENPDQRRLWANDPDGCAETGAAEVIRWATPIVHFRRTATRDAEVGGQRVAEGDKVVMFYRSANRDESVFDDPYRFDVRRRGRQPHLAFGAGIHFCMGAHLARTEVGTLFGELLTRIPDIHVAGEPVRSGGNMAHAFDELHCEFTPGGALAERSTA